MVALEALKLADSGDRDDIADIIADVTFDGVTGFIAFDENGDAKRNQAFIIKSDNETATWEFVKVQTVSDISK
jgi:branched-chain amino acid transport system substrate-binding protein